jgi:hypothetical protein
MVVRPTTDRTTTIVMSMSTVAVTWKSTAMTMRRTVVTTISPMRTTVVRESCSARIGKVRGSSVAARGYTRVELR